MFNSHFKINTSCLFVLAATTALLTCGQAHAGINFSDFSSTAGLQLNGNAAQAGNALRIVPASSSQAGSAFTNSTLNISVFSTSFKFQITDSGGASDGSGLGADGITFTIQGNGPGSIGGGGGGLGYSGMLNSVAVEFDTWNNGPSDDDDSNHAGIDTDGDLDSVETVSIPGQFNDGNVWHAWIEYNGTTLEVRTNSTGAYPAIPDLSIAIDIADLVGSTNAFVGFTGGTGAAFGHHDLLCWNFNCPPDCSTAAPSVATIWPPNHKFVPITITGVTDPDGDSVTITIDSIFQDEPVDAKGSGNTAPDGKGVGTDTAEVRAERSGSKKVPGNGRVYHIGFTADDGNGGTCSSTVTVCVPHDQSGTDCVDDGLLYDSTAL